MTVSRYLCPYHQGVQMRKHFQRICGLATYATLVLGLLWAGAGVSAQEETPGSFSLTDHTGRTVTDADYRGKFMLVFFGYTFCPDVCPTGLQTMSDALDILGTESKKVQPVFITLDPKRDTPKALAGYVSGFHPGLIGLTGTSKQIADIAWDYNVRYFKVFAPPAMGEDATADSQENNDYSLSHSAITYLVGPKGLGLAAFPHGISPEEMAKEIQSFISTP